MIFIVGVGRSGTSLLHSILNAHSEVTFIPEINFIRRFLSSSILTDLYKSKGDNGLINMLETDSTIKRLNIEIGNSNRVRSSTSSRL